MREVILIQSSDIPVEVVGEFIATYELIDRSYVEWCPGSTTETDNQVDKDLDKALLSMGLEGCDVIVTFD